MQNPKEHGKVYNTGRMGGWVFGLLVDWVT